MIKVAEGQKVQLEENCFATITSEGTLIIEYVTEGPLGQDRAHCIGLSTVGTQALLDLLANGEAVEHGVQATGLTFCLRCGIWQPVNAAGECGICHPPRA